MSPFKRCVSVCVVCVCVRDDSGTKLVMSVSRAQQAHTHTYFVLAFELRLVGLCVGNWAVHRSVPRHVAAFCEGGCLARGAFMSAVRCLTDRGWGTQAQTQRERERETERQRDRDRETERETERETDRQRERGPHPHTLTYTHPYGSCSRRTVVGVGKTTLRSHVLEAKKSMHKKAKGHAQSFCTKDSTPTHRTHEHGGRETSTNTHRDEHNVVLQGREGQCAAIKLCGLKVKELAARRGHVVVLPWIRGCFGWFEG